jgi:hypothetical protein
MVVGPRLTNEFRIIGCEHKRDAIRPRHMCKATKCRSTHALPSRDVTCVLVTPDLRILEMKAAGFGR